MKKVPSFGEENSVSISKDNSNATIRIPNEIVKIISKRMNDYILSRERYEKIEKDMRKGEE